MNQYAARLQESNTNLLEPENLKNDWIIFREKSIKCSDVEFCEHDFEKESSSTYHKEKLCARLKCELCEIKFREESDLKTPTRKQFGAMNVRKNEIVNTTTPGLGALNAI